MTRMRSLRINGAWIVLLAWAGVSRTAVEPQSQVARLQAQLLALHNQVRAQRDLAPLELNETLSHAARVHVADMMANGHVEHEGSDGSQASDRVERQGYRYLKVAENLAAGQRSALEAMKGWMNSPEHHENVVGDFSEIGAWVGRDRRGRTYWCVVFATPLPERDPDQTAQEVIQLMNKRRSEADLEPLESDETLMELAAAHAAAMVEAESLRPKRFQPIEEVQKRGLRFEALTYTAQTGQLDPERLLRSLTERQENAERHVLGPFDHVGVGYRTTENGTPYWSLILLRKLRACPEWNL